MSKRYFTLEDVNPLVPVLGETWGRIIRVRAQLKALYQRLEQRKFAPTNDDFEPVVSGAPEDVIKDRATFRALVDVLKADLEAVQDMGCLIKDLDTGLVDWWAKSGDREVLLCWRFGEREVGFFHDLEAGFAGRRPVAELMPPTPALRLVH